MNGAASTFRRAPRPSGRRWLIAAVALLAGLVLEWSDSPNLPGRGLDRLISDQAVRWRALTDPETRVAVVDIDERSLAQQGPWPWPRERIAGLAETLIGDCRARAVALDFVLPERADDAGDERLAALALHAPIVFSQAFDYVERTPALRVGVRAAGMAAAPGASTVRATGYIGNFAGLARAAHVGNIGLVPDADGAIRRLPLRTLMNGAVYWPLAFALLEAGGLPRPQDPVTREGFWTIPYGRQWSSYSVIPVADIQRGSAGCDAVAGRLIIVGSSSFGLADRVATPLDRSTAGAMVHAAAVSALLDAGTAASTPAWDARWTATGWLLVSVMFGLFGLPRLSAGRGAVVLGALAGVWLLLALGWVPLDANYSGFAPLLSLLLLTALAVPNEWRLAQIDSRRLIRTFEHYVARPVLDQLLSRADMDSLEPRLLQVTTLVADMEGYSALVENAPLDEAVALTRGFLDRITAPVLAHDGTLDKYIGDGLMAFFGAPLASADHADQAVDAARAMLAAVSEFNLERQSRGLAPVRVRVGIETGLAVAGDLGTPFRSVYTAVGDSVNMASRLQEVARGLPHDVIIGPGAAQAVRRHNLTSLGQMNVRGRRNQLELFTTGSED